MKLVAIGLLGLAGGLAVAYGGRVLGEAWRADDDVGVGFVLAGSVVVALALHEARR